MSKLAPYYKGIKDTITAKKASEETFSVLFAKDLSTENIAIIVEVIAHKQIASESIVVEVI